MPAPEHPHSREVEGLLSTAAAEHRLVLARLPESIARSLPVDAQGIQSAIDYLGSAAGLSDAEQRDLIRPHAVNPAVLHARVFGAQGLADETVLGAFVEGARVRAGALTVLADAVGGEALGAAVRVCLANDPPPGPDAELAIDELTATYAAHEHAVLMIAAALDDLDNP